MRIRLDNVMDRNAISCVCDQDVEQGQVLKLVGIADHLGAVSGECYQVIKSSCDFTEVSVVVAHDGHSYSDEEYNFADKATIKAGKPFRAYILCGYQVVTVEKEVCVESNLGVGRPINPNNDGKWEVGEMGIGIVLAETKLGDKDAVQILVVK